MFERAFRFVLNARLLQQTRVYFLLCLNARYVLNARLFCFFVLLNAHLCFVERVFMLFLNARLFCCLDARFFVFVVVERAFICVCLNARLLLFEHAFFFKKKVNVRFVFV